MIEVPKTEESYESKTGESGWSVGGPIVSFIVEKSEPLQSLLVDFNGGQIVLDGDLFFGCMIESRIPRTIGDHWNPDSRRKNIHV